MAVHWPISKVIFQHVKLAMSISHVAAVRKPVEYTSKDIPPGNGDHREQYSDG
jgi:hypothetical protein